MPIYNPGSDFLPGSDDGPKKYPCVLFHPILNGVQQ